VGFGGILRSILITNRMSQTAYIGLGSNLSSPAGPPSEIVLAAIESLATIGGISARSSLYRTAPVGYQNQPAFINAAIALRTGQDPESLLKCLLAIERSFGRDRATGVPKGPRTLDLDLLLMDGLVLETPSLTLPHPELAHRRFVLAPLAEIAPDLLHPVLRRRMRELLAELPIDGPNNADAIQILPSAGPAYRGI
jgi:2-amino-4-hydroxy-6-hydroxymethyldihydropteridine diphosphokinase